MRMAWRLAVVLLAGCANPREVDTDPGPQDAVSEAPPDAHVDDADGYDDADSDTAADTAVDTGVLTIEDTVPMSPDTSSVDTAATFDTAPSVDSAPADARVTMSTAMPMAGDSASCGVAPDGSATFTAGKACYLSGTRFLSTFASFDRMDVRLNVDTSALTCTADLVVQAGASLSTTVHVVPGAKFVNVSVEIGDGGVAPMAPLTLRVWGTVCGPIQVQPSIFYLRVTP